MSAANKPTAELWRTMKEPEIDPLMEEGLRSSREFRNWWVHQFYPHINDPQLACVRANDWRPPETGQQRETDLHVEILDSQSKRYALLIESKVNAPASTRQPEDYSAYAQWGKTDERWDHACTVLMAPRGYLKSSRSAEKYDQTIAYEEIAEESRRHGLTHLADYLLAGVKRYSHTGSARNPNDTVGAFRVNYIDLLRDQDPDLHRRLQGTDSTQFDKSQTWFYFDLPDMDQIVHKPSNKRTKERDRNDPQCLSLHARKDRLKLDVQLDTLPDFGFRGEQRWRESKSKSKKNFIKDIRLPEDLCMFFETFDQEDQEKAFRVWRLTEELRTTWQALVATGIYHKQ